MNAVRNGMVGMATAPMVATNASALPINFRQSWMGY